MHTCRLTYTYVITQFNMCITHFGIHLYLVTHTVP